MSDNYERWLEESLATLIAGVPEEEVDELLSTMRYRSAPSGQKVIDRYRRAGGWHRNLIVNLPLVVIGTKGQPVPAFARSYHIHRGFCWTRKPGKARSHLRRDAGLDGCMMTVG
jgi:hypothetical protein